MIIWGFRTKAALLATIMMTCRNGHVAAHRIIKSTRWFTLFFIPLIPYRRSHRSVCIQCGLTLEIPQEQAEALVAQAAGNASPGEAVPTPTEEVVSPPLPSGGPTAPPAGWYPDPAGAPNQRYWDGQAWTESVHPS